MARNYFILLCLLLMGMGLAPVQAGGDEKALCLEVLPSNLRVGGEGMVLPGPSNNVRVEPGISGNPADILGKIPAYGVFTVLDGPVCSGEYVWWKIDYEGLQGWTVEGSTSDGYFVVRFDDDGYPVAYGEDRDQTYYAAKSEKIRADENDRFTFHGVSITIPGAFDTMTGVERVALNPYNTSYPWWEVSPAHIHLRYDAERYINIEVFSAEAYDAYYPGVIARLRAQLNERPEQITLTDLWMMNAVIIMRARPGYIEAPWGTLYRDLLDFGQSLESVDDHYTYLALGLTSDDRYFIRVMSGTYVDMPQHIMDVGAGGYPFDASEEEQQASTDALMQAYVDGIIYLNQAPPEVFTPRLEELDTILASLEISPEALSEQWGIPQELIDFPRPTPTPSAP